MHVGFVGVAFLLLPTANAFAQSAGFEAQSLRPSTNLETNILSTSSAELVGRGRLWAGALFSYSNNPILLRDTSQLAPPYTPVNGQVVTDLSVLHVLAAYGLLDWLEVGIDIPLVLRQEGARLSGLQDPGAVDSSFGLGDLRIVPKAQIISFGRGLDGHAISLATSVDVDLPTGDRDRFQGGGFKLVPRVVAEWKTPFDLRVAANLGYLWRANSTDILGLDVGDDVLWSVGVDAPLLASIGPIERVGLFAEVDGGLAIEGIGGAKVAAFGAQLIAGAGLGLVDDPGTPDWRVFAALAYGIGETSAARNAATNSSTPDNYADGTVADSDGDGIPDATDGCRALAEDFDGFQDDDGCPEADNDQDGIVDALDKCPGEAEDRDGFEDGDGCIDADDDNDGIADTQDACRLDAEDIDGDRDDDGCPDFEVSVAVDVVIYFDSDSNAVPARDHYQLDRVARTLMAAPRGVHVWVEGHADDSGSSTHNKALSKQRADNIRNYLVARGVPATRMTTIAWGETYNVRDNTTDLGKLTNRRVEFRATPRSTPPEEPLPLMTNTSTRSM